MHPAVTWDIEPVLIQVIIDSHTSPIKDCLVSPGFRCRVYSYWGDTQLQMWMLKLPYYSKHIRTCTQERIRDVLCQLKCQATFWCSKDTETSTIWRLLLVKPSEAFISEVSIFFSRQSVTLARKSPVVWKTFPKKKLFCVREADISDRPSLTLSERQFFGKHDRAHTLIILSPSQVSPDFPARWRKWTLHYEL